MRPRLTKGERAYQKALSILLSLPEYYQQKAYIELRSRMPQIKPLVMSIPFAWGKIWGIWGNKNVALGIMDYIYLQ